MVGVLLHQNRPHDMGPVDMGQPEHVLQRKEELPNGHLTAFGGDLLGGQRPLWMRSGCQTILARGDPTETMVFSGGAPSPLAESNSELASPWRATESWGRYPGLAGSAAALRAITHDSSNRTKVQNTRARL